MSTRSDAARRGTLVALVAGYALVAVLVDPVVALRGPFGVIVQPSEGLPALLGVCFGPVGVAGVVGGELVEALYGGGDPAYTLAVAVGEGTTATLAWLLWTRLRSVDGPGLGVVATSLALVVVAAVLFGSAALAGIAAALGGYALAPLAVEGAVGGTVATLVLGALWFGLSRVDALPEPIAIERDDAVGLPRSAALAAVGVLWLVAASGFDTVYRDFELLPREVVAKYLPEFVVDVVYFVFYTWWVGALVQLGIAVAVVAVVAGLLGWHPLGDVRGDPADGR